MSKNADVLWKQPETLRIKSSRDFLRFQKTGGLPKKKNKKRVLNLSSRSHTGMSSRRFGIVDYSYRGHNNSIKKKMIKKNIYKLPEINTFTINHNGNMVLKKHKFYERNVTTD